jgi:uncharacterized membrane protein
MKFTRPHLILLLLLLLGLGLRFWGLDLKPMWLDEVITAIAAMGRQYSEIPTGQFFLISQLDEFFTVQPGLSCGEVTQRLIATSPHPPLFFCLMYGWMNALRPGENWVWALRALPALLGVGAIAAVYALNRVAFSTAAGLAGAAAMAVSPFGVYLSQEARHYTLPVLLITLGLLGLVQMQQDLQRHRFRPWVWLGWAAISGLGLYVHYFCLLALAAQVGALLGWMLLNRGQISRWGWGALGLAIAAVFLLYLPWLPIFWEHLNRPETEWLGLSDGILGKLSPLLQTVVGWVLMAVMMPAEKQPRAIALPAALFMLGYAAWLGRHLWRGGRSLWGKTPQQPAFTLLTGFLALVLLEFAAIVYGLNKDITLAPRYNFVYFPAVCALVGLLLAHLPKGVNARRVGAIALVVGMASSLVVASGLGFYKSFNPLKAASEMYSDDPTTPTSIVVSAPSAQEIALGLSFGLEIRRRAVQDDSTTPIRLGFLPQPAREAEFWEALADMPQPQALPLNLWVVGSSQMPKRSFPAQARLRRPPGSRPRRTRCAIAPDEIHHAANYPYQGYVCPSGVERVPIPQPPYSDPAAAAAGGS